MQKQLVDMLTVSGRRMQWDELLRAIEADSCLEEAVVSMGGPADCFRELWSTGILVFKFKVGRFVELHNDP